MEFYLDTYCGKAFLRLISKGSTVIAELLRLSNNIPRVFFPNSPEHKKYKDLLFGFEYLKDIEAFEDKISEIPEIESLDNSLFNRYSSIIDRFIYLFESKAILEINNHRHHKVQR